MKIDSKIIESPTLHFAQAARKRSLNGEKIYSLGLGEPDFSVPQEIIDATMHVIQTKKSGYSAPLGLPQLRDKISRKLKVENGINCDRNNIFIGAGAKQAFQLIASVILRPKDEVIILNPAYVSFEPQVLIAEPNCKVIKVDVSKSNFSIPIKSIENAITPKTKLLIVNSPNNPAGYILTVKDLSYLYDLSVKHNFYLLSDEIYEKLIFGDQKHFSPGSLESYPKNVITINGFSKSHAMTGWRLGYACIPLELISDVQKIQMHTNTNTCTFIQEAVAIAFDLDMSFIKVYNEKLKRRLNWYKEMVDRTPKISSVFPNGGLFAFLNISETGLDSNTFCSRLLEETGVALTPGIAFGENWDDHVRISFATDDNTVLIGLDMMEKFINKL